MASHLSFVLFLSFLGHLAKCAVTHHKHGSPLPGSHQHHGSPVHGAPQPLWFQFNDIDNEEKADAHDFAEPFHAKQKLGGHLGPDGQARTRHAMRFLVHRRPRPAASRKHRLQPSSNATKMKNHRPEKFADQVPDTRVKPYNDDGSKESEAIVLSTLTEATAPNPGPPELNMRIEPHRSRGHVLESTDSPDVGHSDRQPAKTAPEEDQNHGSGEGEETRPGKENLDPAESPDPQTKEPEVTSQADHASPTQQSELQGVEVLQNRTTAQNNTQHPVSSKLEPTKMNSNQTTLSGEIPEDHTSGTSSSEHRSPEAFESEQPSPRVFAPPQPATFRTSTGLDPAFFIQNFQTRKLNKILEKVETVSRIMQDVTASCGAGSDRVRLPVSLESLRADAAQLRRDGVSNREILTAVLSTMLRKPDEEVSGGGGGRVPSVWGASRTILHCRSKSSFKLRVGSTILIHPALFFEAICKKSEAVKHLKRFHSLSRCGCGDQHFFCFTLMHFILNSRRLFILHPAFV